MQGQSLNTNCLAVAVGGNASITVFWFKRFKRRDFEISEQKAYIINLSIVDNNYIIHVIELNKIDEQQWQKAYPPEHGNKDGGSVSHAREINSKFNINYKITLIEGSGMKLSESVTDH
ncbi:hypothetical protein LOAG_06287 [Loa loa]|uniref:Uncharacterized protein n=1 Tax=Loa loa TaxID=7209 RepID=A0A1S0TZ09_LOALO|nr:hypothetical protein LOAG_06287 [Loa loa]EFO22198.1 hypothetical protein LOAG_06287 [Loa loa]